MFEKLRHLDLDRLDVDEAVALVAYGEVLQAAYASRGLETPQWLNDNVRELNREIRNRHRDNLEKAKRETEAQLETLKSRDERREDLKSKLDRLNQALDTGK